MLADMQRARALADDLPKTGWDVEVLVPDIAFQHPVYIEPESRELMPEGIPVHYVPIYGDKMLRSLGLGSVGWRSLVPMYKLGSKLLQQKRFDLVYFSTTQFILFCLGRLWWHRLGVPYVLDFHDPWFKVASRQQYITVSPNLKFKFSSWLARSLERFALRGAAGLVSVSPLYLEEMELRYPDFPVMQRGCSAVIPFGATVKDFDVALQNTVPKHNSQQTDRFEIVYVGAGGSIMAKSFRRIAQSLARLRRLYPEKIEKLRIRLFGTYAYWKPGDPKDLEAIAQQEGIGDLVEEHPARIGYLQAMKIISRAQGLLILGVDDPAYMPSKLFTYALTGKPLLCCFHHDSQAKRYFYEMPELGRLILFGGEETVRLDEDAIMSAFVNDVVTRQLFERKEVLNNYLSPMLAQRHAEFYECCLSHLS